MKKILSVLLAVLIMGISTVTAFAEDNNTESTNEENYSSLEEAKEDVLDCAFKYEEYFLKYSFLFSPDIPLWSEQSSNNLEDTLDYVNNAVYDFDTIDEVVGLKNLLNHAESEMCVELGELKWMLDYMKKDYESVGYYDEDTTSEIKTIYELAQSDYLSGDEKLIHKSYVSLRNLLNELCLYNQIPGDVNKDGKLTIDDVTLIQKNLADLTQFNSSQNYIAGITKVSNIDMVTTWQKDIISLSSKSANINQEIDKLVNTDYIDSNRKYEVFNYHTENDNYMFHIDRYYILLEE